MAKEPVEGDEQDLEAPDLDAADRMVEIYITDNDVAAGFVIDEILAPGSVDAVSHDRRSHALFAPAAMPGEIGIAVPAEQAARARQLLRDARRDGALTEDGGQIVDEEGGTATA